MKTREELLTSMFGVSKNPILLEGLDVRLKRARIICPFHKEKTPSMVLQPATTDNKHGVAFCHVCRKIYDYETFKSHDGEKEVTSAIFYRVVHDIKVTLS